MSLLQQSRRRHRIEKLELAKRDEPARGDRKFPLEIVRLLAFQETTSLTDKDYASIAEYEPEIRKHLWQPEYGRQPKRFRHLLRGLWERWGRFDDSKGLD